MKIKQINRTFLKQLLIVLIFMSVFYLAVFMPYFVNSLSFLDRGDGLNQYFFSVVKTQEYYKEVINNLLSGNGFSLKMWDRSLGLGEDPLMALNYYGIFNPLMLLSLFFKKEKLGLFFSLLYFIKYILAALSLFFYGYYHKWKLSAIIAADVIYCFCGYCLLIGRLSICYMDPVILFPLIILGTDMIADGKKPFVYILSVFALGYLSFYFLYMAGMLSFIYFVELLVFRRIKKEQYDLKNILAKYIISNVIAFLMAMVSLLPIVNHVLGSARLSGGNAKHLLYPFGYYLKYFLGFTKHIAVESYTFLGFSAFAVIAVLVLFIGPVKKNIGLKLIFIQVVLITLFSICGSVLNGFAYGTNRWTWAYAFMMAVITASLINEAPKMNIIQKLAAIVLNVAYAVISVITPLTNNKTNHKWVIFTVVVGVLFIIILSLKDEKKKEILSCALVIATVFFGEVFMLYLNGGLDKLKEKNYTFDACYDAMKLPGVYDMLPEEEEPYRVDFYGDSVGSNTTAMNDVMGINCYTSVTNPYTSEYLKDVELNVNRTFHYKDFDGRLILDSLWGVKYYMIYENGFQALPFGYYDTGKSAQGDEGKILLYKTDNSLPLGYCYDKRITEEEFDKLDIAKKQEVMLYAAVTSDAELPDFDGELRSRPLVKNIEENTNVDIEGNTYYVKADKASVDVEIEDIGEGEVYGVIEPLSIAPFSEEEKVNYLGTYDEMTEEEKEDYQKEILEDMRVDEAGFGVSAYDMEVYRSCNIKNNEYLYYTGNTKKLLNMGTFDETPEFVRVHFRSMGTYTFDNLNFYYQPVDEIIDRVEELGKYSLKDIEFGMNTVQGKIEVPDDRLLALAVPYSKGWKAYVDGKETKVLKINIGQTGIMLNSGAHEIVFKYETPYLKIGIVLSIIGVVLLIGYLYYYNRGNKYWVDFHEEQF